MNKKADEMVKNCFVLKKKGAAFTHRQRDFIQFHIELSKNWIQFKDLIKVEFVSIDNNSFIVSVIDTGTTWHSQFSQKLCKKATLDEHVIYPYGQPQLFDVEEIKDI